MDLKDFFHEIDNEIESIVSSEFEINITNAYTVPNVDDQGITYDNLDSNNKKGKVIETCILYIDIRRSTEISVNHRPITLTRLYSAFVRTMVKSARYFGGHVRGIVGDRVMVVFDVENCYENAINTAILLNSVAKYQLNKHFTHDDIRCGIGIDFGKMLVIKTGIVRQGKENQFYKSLVWLGRPANIASKLTDMANKENTETEKGVLVNLHYPLTDKDYYYRMSIESFAENIEFDFISPSMKYKDEFFSFFIPTNIEQYSKTKPILITDEVYKGFKKNVPNAQSVRESWWKLQKLDVDGYSGKIYGADVYYTAVKD